MSATVASKFQFVAPPEDYVGEVRATVRLHNTTDRGNAKRGALSPDQVRSATIEAIVDTGANSLVLPQEVVDQLGLDEDDSTIVEYADGRTAERPVAGPVRVEVLGRGRSFDCVVGQPGTPALLGQVVLEMLDLLVDCKNQVLVVRPESPYRTRYAIRASGHGHLD